MVRSLVAAGLPRPTVIVGNVVEALARAGLFRVRGVLVGTAAFQCYGGYLGVRLPASSVTTADADFAQVRSISISVEDNLPPMVETLRAIDPSFEAASGLDPLAAMPASGGIGAQPIRFLDFLIRQPVRSVMLHGGGVLVTIPAPQRYAIHKLIVTVRRRDDDNGRQKARKDIAQAGLLLSALEQERRLDDAGEALLEAWDRRPKWRDALARGRGRLNDAARAALDEGPTTACRMLGGKPPLAA